MPKKKPLLVTEEPPSVVRVLRYDWEAIADELRAEPMVWKRVFQKDTSGFAVAIQNQDNKSLRKSDGFEARTANNTRGRAKGTNGPKDEGEPRTCSLYLRFNPDLITKEHH